MKHRIALCQIALFAALLVAGTLPSAQAQCGSAKCCSAPSCAAPCRPVVCRPSSCLSCTYQRDRCKPACGCGTGCGPVVDSCCPVQSSCASRWGGIRGGCRPLAGLFSPRSNVGCNTACAPACSVPCVTNSCAPSCAARCAPVCAAPQQATCCEPESKCCKDPQCIAELIYKSQTCCYARQRARALRQLGRRYSCVCYPEIMCAFVYGMNDADERVRKQAVYEVIRQNHRNKNCCCSSVVGPLQTALADCDKGVRRLAAKALCECGYDVKDCNSCGTCGTCGTLTSTGTTEIAPFVPPAPATSEPAPLPPSNNYEESTEGVKVPAFPEAPAPVEIIPKAKAVEEEPKAEPEAEAEAEDAPKPKPAVKKPAVEEPEEEKKEEKEGTSARSNYRPRLGVAPATRGCRKLQSRGSQMAGM